MTKKLIAKFKLTSVSPNKEKTLCIYENSKGLRGSICDSAGRVFGTAMFYHDDKDANIYRVKEYFGFTNTNSIQIFP